jgi:WD40 repeat protein
MIDAEGNPRLMDFGLAKREEADETITAPNQVIGTPAFMSPEQAWGKQGKTKNAEGEHKVDRRSDVYSLGAVLYQLLTRELPFRGEPQVVRRKLIEDDPKPPREINDQIPIDLERICQKAMAKEPADRYRTAGDLAADLERWLRGEPVLARHVGPLERSWRWSRRNPLTAGLVTSIALLVTTIACFATVMYAMEHRAKTRLEEAVLENREMLSQFYVERANRHLGPEGVVEAYSPIKALPWLYAAMEIDESDPARREASRIRLGATLRAAPRVERIWSHGGPIYTVAGSPSGDHFFTGGPDGMARIWDSTRDEPASPALIHSQAVTDGAFSPDGKTLLTGCGDGAARLWDVGSGRLLLGPLWDAEHSKDAAAPRSGAQFDLRVSWSATGRFFVTIRGRVAQVWEIKTARPVAPPMIAPLWIGSAEFMHGDALLLVGCADGSIRVWDVRTGKQQQVLEGSAHTSTHLPPVVSPDGATVASAGSPQSIAFWDTQSGKRRPLLPLTHEGALCVARYSTEGQFLATGTEDGTVCLWRSADGRLVWKRRVTQGQVFALEFSPHRPELAVQHRRSPVYVLDLGGGNLVAEPIVLPEDLRPAKWVGTSGLLAIASAKGTVRLWRMESREPALPLPHSAAVACAVATADRRLAATVDRDGICCLLGLSSDHPPRRNDVAKFAANIEKPVAVAISGDGKKLAIADSRSAVFIFDLSQGRSLVARLPQSGPVGKIAFTSDSRFLIAVSNVGRVSAWDASSGERAHEQDLGLNAPFFDADIAPRVNLSAVALGKHVVVCNVLTGARVGPTLTHDQAVWACRLSPDGRLLVSGSEDGTARVWELATGKLLAATPKLSAGIRSVEFSSDVTRFVAGCSNGTARIWSTVDARPVSKVLLHGPIVAGCLFSPDSRWLVTMGDTNALPAETILRVWDGKSGEPLFVRPISRLSRQFSGSWEPPGGINVWHAVSTFFSPDGRRLQVVTTAGVLGTFDLAPDGRSSRDLLREVAVRSGTQPDSNGELLFLEPDHLVSLWRSAAEKR